MHEVLINGVRYVPAEDLPPAEGSVFIFGQTLFDSRWFPVTWGPRPPEQLALGDSDIIEAAGEFDVPPAHIDAVRQVEAGSSGFLLNESPPSRPKILFEGHWFYKLTPEPVSKVRPDLSHPKWTKKYYKGGSAEWGRLEDAAGFDLLNALKSASWGLGQVMGFNYAAAGCDSIEQFVVEAFSGEAAQFKHMMNFIEHNGLMDELRRGDWRGFARGYNGSGYAANSYDTKLAAAAKASKFA